MTADTPQLPVWRLHGLRAGYLVLVVALRALELRDGAR